MMVLVIGWFLGRWRPVGVSGFFVRQWPDLPININARDAESANVGRRVDWELWGPVVTIVQGVHSTPYRVHGYDKCLAK